MHATICFGDIVIKQCRERFTNYSILLECDSAVSHANTKHEFFRIIIGCLNLSSKTLLWDDSNSSLINPIVPQSPHHFSSTENKQPVIPVQQ